MIKRWRGLYSVAVCMLGDFSFRRGDDAGFFSEGENLDFKVSRYRRLISGFLFGRKE